MVALPRRNQAQRTSRIATRAVDPGDRAPARSRSSAPREARRLERLCSTRIEEAEEAELAQAAILQAISHDLRNPLSVIVISAQLLTNKTAADQPTRRQVDVIARAAVELDQILNDVSDIGKISSGRLILRRVACEASAMIDRVLGAVGPQAEAKSIRLSREIAEDVPVLIGDRDRIVKILADLVGGALKITPRQGSVTIRVARDDGGARFSVTDSGAGISKEKRPLVFTIPGGPRRETIQGTGLAFYAAKGIIEAHGGRIWVESEVGQGSTFSFMLPAGDAALIDEEEELVTAPSTA